MNEGIKRPPEELLNPNNPSKRGNKEQQREAEEQRDLDAQKITEAMRKLEEQGVASFKVQNIQTMYAQLHPEFNGVVSAWLTRSIIIRLNRLGLRRLGSGKSNGAKIYVLDKKIPEDL